MREKINFPLRYDPETNCIMDSKDFVFLHSDGLGTGGTNHGDEERAEFQRERSEYLVRIINHAAPKPKYYPEPEFKTSWIEDKERGVPNYDPPTDGSSWVEDRERKRKIKY